MQKNWISLGLMSGTSGDGVDASIIRTNGMDNYESIKDKYFEDRIIEVETPCEDFRDEVTKEITMSN